VTAEIERKIEELDKEFRECRDTVGNRMLIMERESIEKLTRLETQMTSIMLSLSTFVSQSRFRPVELIAFGLAGGALMTMLGAVLARVLGLPIV
jgi:hypothetical protein